MEDGQLSTISHWVGKSGKTLLEEKRDMIFSAQPNQYTIDFNITLTAQDEKIVFGDTKEGMFAIRVADWLSEDKGTGKYLDSDGNIGEPNIWGKKAIGLVWKQLKTAKQSVSQFSITQEARVTQPIGTQGVTACFLPIP